MLAEDSQRIPRRRSCHANQLRKKLRRSAIHKDESRNSADSNLLFPPSMIETHLDYESVQAVQNCSCGLCRLVIDKEPFNDARLVDEIRREPGTRLLLAILVYMRKGFAMRQLYRHGLGRDNNLNVEEAFSNNADLKFKLFGHTSSVDEQVAKFCATFVRTKQVFNPPFFHEEENFREIPPTSNLPFIGEVELRSLESSSARLYRFRIHQGFCSQALSVRSHFKSIEPTEANEFACDRN